MRVECHRLDLKYEDLRVRKRREEAHLSVRFQMEGQDSPLTVVKSSEDRFVVVDGFGRLRALQRVGLDEADVTVLEGDEATALVQVYRMASSGGWSAVEEALLVQTLLGMGWSQARVGLGLGRSTSWVSRRLSLLSSMPARVLNEVKEGRLCAHGAERALVPLARANEQAAEALVDHLEGERVGSRSLVRLYELWRDGDMKTREWVVSHPMAVLKAWQERRTEDPSSCPIVVSLEQCRNLLVSSRRRLKTETSLPWISEQRRRMTCLLDEVVSLVLSPALFCQRVEVLI